MDTEEFSKYRDECLQKVNMTIDSLMNETAYGRLDLNNIKHTGYLDCYWTNRGLIDEWMVIDFAKFKPGLVVAFKQVLEGAEATLAADRSINACRGERSDTKGKTVMKFLTCIMKQVEIIVQQALIQSFNERTESVRTTG